MNTLIVVLTPGPSKSIASWRSIKVRVGSEFVPVAFAFVLPMLPSSRCTDPNVLAAEMRSSSLSNSPSSAWLAWRAAMLLVPEFAAETDRSRARFRIVFTCPSAPSVVCSIEMPSCALRAAWRRPEACARSCSLITSPEASSLALFTRLPVESRSTLLVILVFVPRR
jgi:hypothetical protein